MFPLGQNPYMYAHIKHHHVGRNRGFPETRGQFQKQEDSLPCKLYSVNNHRRHSTPPGYQTRRRREPTADCLLVKFLHTFTRQGPVPRRVSSGIHLPSSLSRHIYEFRFEVAGCGDGSLFTDHGSDSIETLNH